MKAHNKVSESEISMDKRQSFEVEIEFNKDKQGKIIEVKNIRPKFYSLIRNQSEEQNGGQSYVLNSELISNLDDTVPYPKPFTNSAVCQIRQAFARTTKTKTETPTPNPDFTVHILNKKEQFELMKDRKLRNFKHLSTGRVGRNFKGLGQFQPLLVGNQVVKSDRDIYNFSTN